MTLPDAISLARQIALVLFFLVFCGQLIYLASRPSLEECRGIPLEEDVRDPHQA